MNIKRVKEEIKNSIQAYLSKDIYGMYRIPTVRQRPILLIGPPGIGKTAIMEQVARECKIALVAYTITHHTRQSAIGLPFIEKRNYGGREYAVTEYTMSEIIASVYNKIEQTGLKEGILFIDEINCVSETLAPTMLQFLQGKTFGNQKVPEGWIIAAAGNPPEYNKSVRDFDVVTLDRVKKIEVQEDFGVWKEYAYQKGIHGAIISYLDLKKENFYQIETSIDGKRFVTARGWEDLSELLKVYEELNIPMDEEVAGQYLQHKKIAADFINYLYLYRKYQTDYNIEAIIDGNLSDVAWEPLQTAPFDEKLSVIGLLLSRLSESFALVFHTDRTVTALYEQLIELKKAMGGKAALADLMEEGAEQWEEQIGRKRQADLYDRDEERDIRNALQAYQGYSRVIKGGKQDQEEAFTLVKSMFQGQIDHRKKLIEEAALNLEHGFDFMEQTFGESQEMVIFITELTTNYYSMKFISEYGCERYYQYHKGLLFGETQRGILKEIASMQGEWEGL